MSPPRVRLLCCAAVFGWLPGEPLVGEDCNQNGVPDDRDFLPVNPVLEPSGEIPASESDAPLEMEFADVDADGDLDLVGLFVDRAVPAIEVILNDGTQTFTPEIHLPLAGSPQSHVTGDLDSDGDLDVAVVYSGPPYGMLHLNSGGGNFSVTAPLPVDRAHTGILAADLGGDEDLDLVLCGGFLPGVTVLRNQGHAVFSGETLFPDLELKAARGGDLDGDGDVDLAALVSSGLVASLNAGSGNLSAPRITDASHYGDSLLASDLDSDGDLDLAASGFDELLVFSNRGSAMFEPAYYGFSLAPKTIPNRGRMAILATDLDGDGRQDLLALAQGPREYGLISLLRNLGGGVFSRGTIVARSRPYPSGMALLDANDAGVQLAVSRWDGSRITLLRPGLGANSGDCNTNGLPDECDIAALLSPDCDQNGVPDSCPGFADCNGNGIPDACDIAGTLERDCNGNAIPDSCDLELGTSVDRGDDNIPDECQAEFDELCTFGFEGCPERIQGAPGEVKILQIFPSLTLANAPAQEGVQGWQISIVVEGAEVESVTTEGVRVSTIFDHDGNPATLPLDPYEFDLKDTAYHVTQKASGSNGGQAPIESKGMVSALVLHFTKSMVLKPGLSHRLARMVIKVAVPEDESPATVRFAYVEGMHGDGHGHPYNNDVTVDGATRSCVVTTCVAATAIVQPFLRCDANDDLHVDIADPIWTLNELFGASNPAKTRCRFAADCNGDGRKDISDAIFGLAFLFLGGRLPPLPFPGCGTGDEIGSCDFGSTACR